MPHYILFVSINSEWYCELKKVLACDGISPLVYSNLKSSHNIHRIAIRIQMTLKSTLGMKRCVDIQYILFPIICLDTYIFIYTLYIHIYGHRYIYIYILYI